MSESARGHEHEFEPEFGLPEPLPLGETILWQGAPDFKALAVRVFHLRKLAWYFLALIVMRVSYLYATSLTGFELLMALIWPVALATVGLASVACLAWLTARTTAYTLTDRRVVMRIGIVLTLTFNLPLRTIEAAGLRVDADGSGDIPLRLGQGDRIAWLQLWPHVRPWMVTHPQPSLRCVPNVRDVAALMAKSWSEVTGVAALTPPSTVTGQASSKPAPWQPSLT